MLIVGGQQLANGSSSLTVMNLEEHGDLPRLRAVFATTTSQRGGSLVTLAKGDVLAVGDAYYNPATATWTPTGSYPPAGFGTGGGGYTVLLGTGKCPITVS